MTGSFAFVVALLPLLSQVSAFDRCDSAIIKNIQNSGLTPFAVPKPALFQNKQFSYNYVSSTDTELIESADITFEKAQKEGTVLRAKLTLYGSGPEEKPSSTSITFTEKGDKYGVDFKGFIDSATSKNQVYIWQVEGVVVAYYCSLDANKDTSEPLFTLNAETNSCVSEAQRKAAQKTVDKVTNNSGVKLAKLDSPPTARKC